MSLTVGSEQKALISGEIGNVIELGEIASVDDTYSKALVSVRSDWYQATVRFEASNERFHEFIDALDVLINKGYGQANFINEDGNFDLDVQLTSLGKVSVRGVLCKSMADDLQVKYGFIADRISLEDFLRTLKFFFPQKIPERRLHSS